MSNDYSTEADLVGDAMDAVYENKQVNKKNNISGDFSSDSASYPTVKAVKTQYEGSGTAKNAHTHGSISTDGKIGSDSGKIVTTGSNGALQASASVGVDKTTDANAGNYSNIGSLSSGATQQQINNAINTKIGQITGLDVINIVTTRPTASADTMHKLYIVSENSKVNVYYTVEDSTTNPHTYSWNKLDTDILDELSIDWSDIQNKPTILTTADIGDFATALADRINPSS